MTAALRSSPSLFIFILAVSVLAGCAKRPGPYYTEPPEPRSFGREAHTIRSPDAMERPNVTRPEAEAAPDPPQNIVAEKKDLFHKVQWDRETLYTIARWYTGTGNNWTRLAAANPRIDPRRMRIGAVVRIPEALLIRRRPMAAGFLKSGPARKSEPIQKSETPPQPPPVSEDPIPSPSLYGPVVGDGPSDGDEKNKLPVPLETLD